MLYGIQTQKQYRIIQKERNQWANNDMISDAVWHTNSKTVQNNSKRKKPMGEQ